MTAKFLALLFGLTVAAGCSALRAPAPAGTAMAATTVAPQRTEQLPTAAIPTDLAFATSLVHTLNQSDIPVLSVRASKFASMFQSTSEAAWIETRNGVVDVVFFATSDEASQISITRSPNAPAGRSIYIIHASSPALPQDQTIDAAFPLYFTVGHGMFMVTSSQQLDEALKRLFSQR